MNSDNALKAMRFLLLEYDNDRKHLFGEVNTILNTADAFDVQYIIDYLRTRISRISRLEQEYSSVQAMLLQAMQQLETKNAVPNQEASEHRE